MEKNLEKTYDCPLLPDVTNEKERELVCEATSHIAMLVEMAELLLGDLLENDFVYSDKYIQEEGHAAFVARYSRMGAKLRAADEILYHVRTIFDFLNGESNNLTAYYTRCSNGLAGFLK